MTENEYRALLDDATAAVSSWWYGSEFCDIAEPIPYWSELTLGEPSRNRLRRLPDGGLPKPHLTLVGLDADGRPRLVRNCNRLGELASEQILHYGVSTIDRIHINQEGMTEARIPVEVNRGHAELIGRQVCTYEIRYASGGRERYELEWDGDRVAKIHCENTDVQGDTTSRLFTLRYADNGALQAIVDQNGVYAFSVAKRMSREEQEGLADALAGLLRSTIESIAPEEPVWAVIMEYGDLTGLHPVWIALATPRERDELLRAHDVEQGRLEIWAAENYRARVSGLELAPLPHDHQVALDVVEHDIVVKHDGRRARNILLRAREALELASWNQLKLTPESVFVVLQYGESPPSDFRASLGKERYAALVRHGLA